MKKSEEKRKEITMREQEGKMQLAVLPASNRDDGWAVSSTSTSESAFRRQCERNGVACMTEYREYFLGKDVHHCDKYQGCKSKLSSTTWLPFRHNSLQPPFV